VDRGVADALRRVSSGKRADRLLIFLGQAAEALAQDRLDDAHEAIGPVLREAAEVPEVRELAGQIAYRRGEWKRAIRELEAFRAARVHDVMVIPVLADCYRAIGKHQHVDRLWQELREASPRPEVMAEGRIVAAGSLADRGNLLEAIGLLDRASGRPRRVQDHHLRQWYALADLYDRAGEPVQARRLFARIADHDREFFDVLERLAALG
jgi:tetratricopeptide (TPR) repeat protein